MNYRERLIAMIVELCIMHTAYNLFRHAKNIPDDPEERYDIVADAAQCCSKNFFAEVEVKQMLREICRYRLSDADINFLDFVRDLGDITRSDMN